MTQLMLDRMTTAILSRLLPIRALREFAHLSGLCAGTEVDSFRGAACRRQSRTIRRFGPAHRSAAHVRRIAQLFRRFAMSGPRRAFLLLLAVALVVVVFSLGTSFTQMAESPERERGSEFLW